MARKRKKDLKDEAKLINLSAQQAEKMAAAFKSASTALKGVIKSLKEVDKTLDKDNKKTKEFGEGFKDSKNIIDGLTDSLAGMANKLDKSGTLSNILKGNFKEAFKASNLASLGTAAMVSTLIKGMIQIDKLQTQSQKTFGLTDKAAASLQKRTEKIAKDGGKMYITYLDIQKAIAGIAESSGIFAGHLRDDILLGSAIAQKTIGLTNEQMTRLAFNAQTTGASQGVTLMATDDTPSNDEFEFKMANSILTDVSFNEGNVMMLDIGVKALGAGITSGTALIEVSC